MMMRPCILTIIKYFSLIILTHSSYIYEALHNSVDKFEEIMILNTTQVETRLVYNDDFQKNMTQKYVKGNVSWWRNFQNQIGWNTSSYLGLFQSSKHHIVEFCNYMPDEQKQGLIEIKFNILLVEPLINAHIKMEDLIVSMGLKTMCGFGNNFESLI